MTPAERLGLARRLATDPAVPPATSGGRAAAFLLRAALEDVVRSRVRRRFPDATEPSFRAELLTLRATLPPDVAGRVAWAWATLSAATHVHASALPPTAEEIDDWIHVVEDLVEGPP